MRSFPSETRHPACGPRALSELDDSSNHEPLVSMGVLGRLGLLLAIASAIAIIAQLLVGAPH
jgi:hypothetical protein